MLKFQAISGADNGLNAAVGAFVAGKSNAWLWAITAWPQPDGLWLVITDHNPNGSMIVSLGADQQWSDITASLGVTYKDLPNQMRPLVIGDWLVPSNESFSLPIVKRVGDRLTLGPKIGNLRSRSGRLIDGQFVQETKSWGKTTRTVWTNDGNTLVPKSARVEIPAGLPEELRARLAAHEGDITAKTGDINKNNQYAGPSYQYFTADKDGFDGLMIQYAGSYTGWDKYRWWALLLKTPDGTYVDVSDACGLPTDAGYIPLFPLVDLNGDGKPDVLMAYGPNDTTQPNKAGLYIQQPAGKFTLQPNADLTKFLRPFANYIYGYRLVDFSGDGKLDLFLTSYREKGCRIFENQGDGNYELNQSAGNWDAEGFEIVTLPGDKLPSLITGAGSNITIWRNVTVPVDPPNTDPPPDTKPPETDPPKPPEPPPVKTTFPVTINGEVVEVESLVITYTKAAPKPPEDPPPPPDTPEDPPAPSVSGFRHPLESAPPTTDQAKRFLSWVNLTVANPGNPQYGYSRFHAALAYKLTGDEKYADLAVRNLSVQAAKDAVAAGNAPSIANDSYLHVGDSLQSTVFTLLWCGHKIDAQTKADFEDFCRQTIFNVWNPTKATWYGKPFPWTGWATEFPGNNYHYSFLTATAIWALYSGDEQWLTFLRTVKLPKLRDYFAAIPEGGSREGTGYGVSHSHLFALYAIWERSTGEKLADAHCRNSLLYWSHAIQPGAKKISPIGDQPTDWKEGMNDYARALLLKAVYLNSFAPEARVAMHVLRDYPKMTRGENFVDDLWPVPLAQEEPTALSYAAKGVGHYFARSDWAAGATAVTFIAGRLNESHMSEQNGHFDLWGAGTWLCSSNNVLGRSKDGIRQTTDWQNLVVFRDATGKVIPQSRSIVISPQVDDDGTEWSAMVDLGPAYKTPGLNWSRGLIYKRPGKIRVTDMCELPPGVTATWQLNVPVEPTIDQSTLTVTAGKLKLFFSGLVPPTITKRDWRLIAPGLATSGWRIEVVGTEFLVEMEVLNV